MSHQADKKLDASVKSLVSSLISRDGFVRQSARRSLVSIGQPAVPALIQALNSKSSDVRWEAAKALVDIGDPSAATALVETLGHDHFAIRWLAAKGLINLGKKGVEPLLSALLQDPDSGFLRDGAHHVLNALQNADPSLRDVLAPLVDALGALGGTEDIILHTATVLKVIHDRN